MFFLCIIFCISAASAQTNLIANLSSCQHNRVYQYVVTETRAIRLLVFNSSVCQIEIGHANSPSMLGVYVQLRVLYVVCNRDTEVRVVGTKRHAFGGARNRVSLITYSSPKCEDAHLTYFADEQMDTVAVKVVAISGSIVELTVTVADQSGSFFCRQGQPKQYRLNGLLVCDGADNCEDGSDERECPNRVTAPSSVSTVSSDKPVSGMLFVAIGVCTAVLVLVLLGMVFNVLCRRARAASASAARRAPAASASAAAATADQHALGSVNANAHAQPFAASQADGAGKNEAEGGDRLADAPPSYDEATRLCNLAV